MHSFSVSVIREALAATPCAQPNDVHIRALVRAFERLANALEAKDRKDGNNRRGFSKILNFR
jgi:hypothetical protein